MEHPEEKKETAPPPEVIVVPKRILSKPTRLNIARSREGETVGPRSRENEAFTDSTTTQSFISEFSESRLLGLSR